MCILGEELEKIDISITDYHIGFRDWLAPKNKSILLSQNKIEWKIPTMNGNIEDFIKNIPLGIYSFYNYYNYYYNNYNYYFNNYYYNYNNYYYNYYNYNYDYNNYNNYYRIIGECKLWGNTVKHKLGYRSSFASPHILLKLDDLSGRNKDFIDSFNSKVEELAKIYNYKTMTQFEYLSI